MLSAYSDGFLIRMIESAGFTWRRRQRMAAPRPGKVARGALGEETIHRKDDA